MRSAIILPLPKEVYSKDVGMLCLPLPGCHCITNQLDPVHVYICLCLARCRCALRWPSLCAFSCERPGEDCLPKGFHSKDVTDAHISPKSYACALRPAGVP
jgi:hypothetical protein